MAVFSTAVYSPFNPVIKLPELPLQEIEVPHVQILADSFRVTHKAPISISNQIEIEICYKYFQRITQIWRGQNKVDYIVYADLNSKFWEIAPYQKCRTFMGVIIQQIQVLCRITFGGFTVSHKNLKEQIAEYRTLFINTKLESRLDLPSMKGEDAFCQKDVIERQWVIKGRHVNVLYTHKPINELHFLIIPKEHRKTFADLTKEEYVEAVKYAQKLANHYRGSIKVDTAAKDVIKAYAHHKTGKTAGQSVEHWHMHVNITTEKQSRWARLTILFNILIGSSPMKPDKFAEKVKGFRKEFEKL